MPAASGAAPKNWRNYDDDDLTKLFKRLDKDSNGQLSRKELKPLSKKLKGRDMFAEMDSDRSNGISLAEFKRWFGSGAGFQDAMRPGVRRWHDESEGVRMGTGRRKANKGRVGSYKKKHRAVKPKGRRMPKLQ